MSNKSSSGKLLYNKTIPYRSNAISMDILYLRNYYMRAVIIHTICIFIHSERLVKINISY